MLTALRDHVCNPRFQELRVLKLENLKFDPKLEFDPNPENCLVMLPTEALKAYPDTNPPVVAPIDGAAPDAAVELTRLNLELPEEQNYPVQRNKRALLLFGGNL